MSMLLLKTLILFPVRKISDNPQIKLLRCNIGTYTIIFKALWKELAILDGT